MAISQPNTWSQDAKPAPPQSGEGPDLINPERPGKSRRPALVEGCYLRSGVLPR